MAIDLKTKWTWLHTAVALIAFLGEVIGIVKLGEDVFGLNATTVLIACIILNTVAWTVFIMVMFFNIRKENLEIRKENDQLKINNDNLTDLLEWEMGYKEGYGPVGAAFAEIHDLQRTFDTLHPSDEIDEKIFFRLRYVCDHLAKAFQIITKTEGICVGIKLVGGKADQNCIVKTIVRDSYHTNTRKTEKDERHLRLAHDTALNSIFLQLEEETQPDKRYYLCNDLPQEPNFKSSNFNLYHQADWNSKLNAEVREQTWKLPYHSTMVTSIYPAQKKSQTGDTEIPLIGYLCIDSPVKNAFRAGHDNIILAGVGDGLYNILKKLKDTTKVVEIGKSGQVPKSATVSKPASGTRQRGLK